MDREIWNTWQSGPIQVKHMFIQPNAKSDNDEEWMQAVPTEHKPGFLESRDFRDDLEVTVNEQLHLSCPWNAVVKKS